MRSTQQAFFEGDWLAHREFDDAFDFPEYHNDPRSSFDHTPPPHLPAPKRRETNLLINKHLCIARTIKLGVWRGHWLRGEVHLT